MAVNNVTLLVGDSGTGKSSLLGTYAEWVWEKYQKVTLFYSSDGGGVPTNVDGLVQAGIVRLWKMRTRGEAFSTCQKACRGYWPIEFTDIVAGETPPSVALAPPIEKKYHLMCPKCQKIAATRSSKRGFAAMITCGKCGVKVALQASVIEEEVARHPLFEMVGAIAIDGITSMQSWIMEDMAHKTAHGQLKGETTNLGGKIETEDGERFGANNRSHYGFAQTRAESWIHEIANIPGLSVGPVVTARELRATETDSKLPIYGPAIAGKAKAAEVPSWVGNCLGTSVVQNVKGENTWTLHLTEYREDDGIKHLCKTRCTPGSLPASLSDGPVDATTMLPKSGAAPFTQFSLGTFFNLVEESTKSTLEAYKKKYPNAPGVNYLAGVKVEAPPKEEPKAEEPKKEVKKAPPGAAKQPTPKAPEKPKAAVPRPKAPAKKGGPPGKPLAARPIPRPKPKPTK